MNIVTLFAIIGTILIGGAALSDFQETSKTYDGHKVYKVIVKTKEQLDFLRSLKAREKDHVQFWSALSDLKSSFDVMVSAKRNDEVVSTFEKSGISFETLIENVQTLIENENPETRYSLHGDNEVTSISWTAYHRLDVIYNFLDVLAKTYPQWVETIIIGRSYEGRLIKGIKIIFDKRNPGIFVEGGMHAREWISPSVVTYLANEIMSSTNKTFSAEARAHNWFIIPVTNPDGYEYSHTTNRMWRKTRQPYGNCTGADPNRNWDYYWLANDGASTDPCDDEYAGPKPFSEREMKALADYIESVRNQFYIYLSFHSYGEKILLPYGYTKKHLDNYEEAMQVAAAAAKALAKRYGTRYKWGATSDIEYPDCGSSTDYVKGVQKCRFVYCYELRDDGPYYFILPAKQITPTCLEVMDSLVVLMKEARTHATIPAI